jgi:uncharacterized membrane protein
MVTCTGSELPNKRTLCCWWYYHKASVTSFLIMPINCGSLNINFAGWFAIQSLWLTVQMQPKCQAGIYDASSVINNLRLVWVILLSWASMSNKLINDSWSRLSIIIIMFIRTANAYFQIQNEVKFAFCISLFSLDLFECDKLCFPQKCN